MYKYTCQRCKKAFENKDKNKKYCSFFCAKQWKKGPQVCEHCGEQFERAGGRGKYCSQVCSKEASKRGKELPCVNCGNNFYVPLNKLLIHKKDQFCSWECNMEHQRDRRPTRICKHCGKEFRKKCRADAMFCSSECRLNSEYNIEQLAKMRKKQAGTESKLEKDCYKLMEDLGLKFEKQFVFGRRFVADAYVPSHNTLVQFDGDFWHGNEKFHKIVYPLQTAAIERDKRADKLAEKLGYKVVRFWESDLQNNPDVVKSLLTSLT